MKKNNLFSGALILSVGSILAKLFSAVYRISLTRILGGEGIGIYQLIFPFYSLCVVLSSAGLPMAISKVVSKNKGNEIGVLKKCFLFTIIVALILTLILVVSSNGLATLQGQEQISSCYVILAPTIILVSASSVLRGYFQGKHNFIPSSISNIIEQFVKMCVGLILSVSLISVSLFASIVGAVVAIVVSEVVSLVVLLVYIKKEKLTNGKLENISIKNLIKDVVPITLTNVVLPISTFIDSVLVVGLLRINFSNNVSVFLYGLESGAVSSLISLPTIFSFAIASVILPNLASLKHSFNKNKKLTLALKIVLLITIPCVISFTIVPNRLIEVLYQNKLSAYGINGMNIASKLLTISGFGVVFLAVNQIYSSSLQSVDERFKTVRNLTIAVVVKFVIELLFLPAKSLNIYILAVSNLVCYLTAMFLNHMEIKQHFTLKINYNFVAKMVFSNCVMVFAMVSIMSIENSVQNTILSFVIAVIVYFICLFLVNIFNRHDKAMFKYKV